MTFWESFRREIRIGKGSRLWPFVIVFFLCQILFEVSSGTNPLSRIGALAGMSDSGTFAMGPYATGWTQDWARPPSGYYYSNKAPGSILLGFPLYYPYDLLTTSHLEVGSIERFEKRWAVARPIERILSFIQQVLPFGLLALWVGLWADQRNSARERRYIASFTILSMLFGMTPIVFMNTFFGHGLAAVFAVFLVIAWHKQRWYWVGFFYGFALLSDYGAGFMLPPLLLCMAFERIHLQNWGRFVLGGIAPGILWVWYHTAAFGNPFHIASKYQNPEFVDLAHVQEALWGVIHIYPQPEILMKLLFGESRGLLHTQPWIFLLLFLFPFYWKRSFKDLFCWLSIIALLLMNASFGGWHGGSSAGPRYLIPALCLAPFLLISFFEKLAWNGKFQVKDLLNILMIGSIGYSVLLHGMIQVSTILVGSHEPLWPWAIKSVWNHDTPTRLTRFGFFLIALIVASWIHFKKSQKEVNTQAIQLNP